MQLSLPAALQKLVDDAKNNAGQKILDEATNALTSLTKQYELGIITALPLETTAIQTAFGGAVRLPSRARSAVDFYEISLHKGRGEKQIKKQILLAQCVKMGNNSAAVAATAMLADYPSLSDIIMVGIAGGVPHLQRGNSRRGPVDDHVRKGDIVISEQVIQYDMLKLEADRHENRSASMLPSSRLLRAASYLEQEALKGLFPWEALLDDVVERLGWTRPAIDVLHDFRISSNGRRIIRKKLNHPTQSDRRKRKPFVHRAKIGSANILLKNSTVRNNLRTTHKIRAVEMEGSGIADAAWAFNVGYLIVRGICDYCDMDKDNKWQKYAAAAAASYAKLIVDQAVFE